jgi:hypothetical protein
LTNHKKCAIETKQRMKKREKMTYPEALSALNAGNWVSREEWEGWFHLRKNENGMIAMIDPMNGIEHEVRETKGYYRGWEYTPSEESKNATDWYVIKEIRKWR